MTSLTRTKPITTPPAPSQSTGSRPSLCSAPAVGRPAGILTGTNCLSDPTAWHSALQRGLGEAFMTFPEASGLYWNTAAVTRGNSTSQTRAQALWSFPRCCGPAVPKMPGTLTVSSPPRSLNILEASACWQQVWLNVRKCSIPLLQGWHQGAFPVEETGFWEHGRSIPRAENSSLPPFQGPRPHHYMSRCSSYIQRFP